MRVLPDCIPWMGRLDGNGYGRLGGAMAHRVVYEREVGPIPPGLTVDHLCHTIDSECHAGALCQHRRCVNTAHMELVSPSENKRRQAQARKTVCANGHPYDEANTYRRPTGQRDCRACIRERVRRYIERKKEAVA